jgi:hypothetical protein
MPSHTRPSRPTSDTSSPQAAEIPAYMRQAQIRVGGLLLRWTPIARERFVSLDEAAWHNAVEFVEAVYPEPSVDPYLFWLTLEYTYRARNSISALEVREAVQALGDQADLYIKRWVELLRPGAHSPSSFSLSLRIWEHEMLLPEEGAALLREAQGIPAPPTREALLDLLAECDQRAVQRYRGNPAMGGRGAPA